MESPKEEKEKGDSKTLLLKLITSTKSIGLNDAAKKLGLDKKQAYRAAESLRREGRIQIKTRFLQEPQLETISAGVPEPSGKKEAPPKEPEKPKPTSRETAEKLKMAEEKEYKTMETKAPEIPKARKRPKEIKPKKEEEKGIKVDTYTVKMGEVSLPVKIMDTGDYVLHYLVSMPHIDFITRALLDETKRSLVGEVQIETYEMLDTEKYIKLKTKFLKRAKEKLKKTLKRASDDYIEILSRVLVNEMVGLGDLEYLLADDRLEEVVVNSSKDVAWVYHKQHGWLKTNVIIPTEEMIMNYSSRVAREVGREITHLQPLLDAHLITGDRVNATLFPISTVGNTITVRRFSRVPWTIVHFIDPKFGTISVDAAAFLWMAMEYELSMIVSGGTASGKTSMLNALMPFMPANQRILTLEDTRELNLPEYLHWIPLTIRPPNPQGEGEVSMLDLIVNSLRMRPDRIIVGEVRRKRETEVLFEAMHTGHSVYGTFHAEQAHEVVDRITSPPMSIPGEVMKSLHLVVSQYRNRRTGVRRTFEITELAKEGEGGKPGLNTLYKWHPKTDKIEPLYPSVRVKDELELFAGLTEKETTEDIGGKQQVLKWMLKKDIKDVNEVGRIVTEYYLDKDTVLDMVKKKA